MVSAALEGTLVVFDTDTLTRQFEWCPFPGRRFELHDGEDYSGFLDFCGDIDSSDSNSTVVVTEAGKDAVHLLDIRRKRHVGHVCREGSIPGPRGVCASSCGRIVAVSIRRSGHPHAVHLFVRSAGPWCVWKQTKVVDVGLGTRPRSISFCQDNSTLLP